MTVRKSGGRPPRPSNQELLRRLRNAFGPDGTVVVLAEAASQMERGEVTIDDLEQSVRSIHARPVKGSYAYDEATGCWQVSVIGILPDDSVRMHLLIQPEEAEKEEVVLLGIRIPG